jgi:hypothetical protein
MGDAHSACHNTSLGIALLPLSHSVNSLCACSGQLCVNTAEIYIAIYTLYLNLNPMVNTDLHCMQLFI